jgi:hypothetical protein
MPMGQLKGWYPDPDDRNKVRHWSGYAWSESVTIEYHKLNFDGAIRSNPETIDSNNLNFDDAIRSNPEPIESNNPDSPKAGLNISGFLRLVMIILVLVGISFIGGGFNSEPDTKDRCAGLEAYLALEPEGVDPAQFEGCPVPDRIEPEES